MMIALAHFTANARAIQLGHHPVDESDAGSIRLAKLVDSFATVVNRDHLKTRALQDSPDHPECNYLVFGDQYFHESKPPLYTPCPARYASRLGNRVTTSLSKTISAFSVPAWSPWAAIFSSVSTEAAAPSNDRFASMPFSMCAVLAVCRMFFDETASCNSI